LGFPYNPENNLAHSGSQTDDTLGQVNSFVPTTDVNQSLFVVWAGGNDFLQQYDKHWFDDDSWDRQIAYSVGDLSNAVVTLHAKEARFILVPNTVDVTAIPAAHFLPDFMRDYFRGKVRQFNRELAAAMDRIRQALPGLTLFHFDLYSQVKALLPGAAAYGFTETEIDAITDVTLLDKRFDGPGANYVFWDPVHPTTKSHSLIADWFHALVAPQAPQIAVINGADGLDLALTQLHVGKTYVVEESTDLARWSALKCLSTATPTVFARITGALPAVYFRVKWQP